jgi:hypothetical protein
LFRNNTWCCQVRNMSCIPVVNPTTNIIHATAKPAMFGVYISATLIHTLVITHRLLRNIKVFGTTPTFINLFESNALYGFVWPQLLLFLLLLGLCPSYSFLTLSVRTNNRLNLMHVLSVHGFWQVGFSSRWQSVDGGIRVMQLLANSLKHLKVHPMSLNHITSCILGTR